MSSYRFGLGLVLGLLCSTSMAYAILIQTGKDKVGGFMLSNDGTKLRISVPIPDGEAEIREFPLADIKIVHQLDLKRLEGLSPDEPGAYRDYAEELARAEGDPEARDMALHLFLLAARLEPAKLGSSSLLRMGELARTPAEARKFRAMAFLLDAKVQADVLKAEAGKPAAAEKIPPKVLGDFTRALRLYRSGQLTAALDMASHQGMAQVFSRAPGKLSIDTFREWCKEASCSTCRLDGTVKCPTCNGRGYNFNQLVQRVRCTTCNGKKRVACSVCGGTHVRDPLPEETLRAVLRCEVWALNPGGAGEGADPRGAGDANGWSSVVQSKRLKPVVPLSLETITRFDPSKCRYRNRQWVKE